MSEMIQRVARALAQLEGHENLPTLQSAYEQRARVAIEAMREPTDRMLSSGDSMMPQIARGEDITTGYDALREAWPEMISAALEEQHQ